jgi:sec-independent protein translocase protein TatA
MFSSIRGMEWIVILIIVLIFFGPTQLPKLMKMLGEGIRTFKKSLSEDEAKDPRPDEKNDRPDA